MPGTWTRFGAVVLALACATGTAGAGGGESVAGAVTVTGGSARFASNGRTGRALHRLQLRLQVDPSYLPDLHDASEDALRVVLGDTVLLEAEPGDGGYSPRRRARWRWNGEAEGGRARFSADALHGTLRVRLSLADLGALRDSSAIRLPLSLDLGGAHLATEVSFRVRDGRTRRWLRPAQPPADPSPDPDPDPDPDPGPGGAVPVASRSLADGTDANHIAAVNTIVRTQEEWAALWHLHRPLAALPGVDFGKEEVIAAFLAEPTKPSSGPLVFTIRVTSVTDTSKERRVVVEEIPNSGVWTCPLLPDVRCPSPIAFHFVAVPRTSLPTTFELR